MKKKLLAGLATGLFLTVMISVAQATPVQWLSSEGGNDHWYDVFATDSQITWEDARDAAESLGWHLVTMTSAEEDTFVANLLADQGTEYAEKYWLGGFQDTTSPEYTEPSGGWSWVTDEAWVYSNWLWGEPNDGGGRAQDYLHYWLENKWDDMENGRIGPQSMVGYVVETAPVPEPEPVPEPATMLLFGIGFAGLAGYRRRQAKKK